MSNAVEKQFALLQKTGNGDYVLEDHCLAIKAEEAFDEFTNRGWYDGYTKAELGDSDVSPIVINLTELLRTI